MPKAELTLQLPGEEVEFLQTYARQHGTTVTALVVRYVKHLQTHSRPPLHPDILKITGMVPETLDAEAEHRQHLLNKHR